VHTLLPIRGEGVQRQPLGHADQNAAAPGWQIRPPLLAELPQPLLSDTLLLPGERGERACRVVQVAAEAAGGRIFKRGAQERDAGGGVAG
jgi:uncharacterized protein YceK